ncbi:D123-domain-containing protein [Polychytrium aggregatum]|uniref:D123-domain-containing protein n=1 Tax=Polychytrium aggregatum TaxID=110093 RepID=UPI0022FDC0ED|nr:D123-domain-containing protein [Polychytrium aggregatum]KAI9193615.1 D123-domain-containing protein [Polychytrium aggregatum]
MSSDSEVQVEFPPITVQHVRNCEFGSWYPNFRKVSIKSHVISLTPAFVDYLLQDGVFLPLDSAGQVQPSYHATISDDWDGDESAFQEPSGDGDDGDDGDDDDGDDDGDQVEVPQFPELDQTIMDAIDDLGGACFPKLNWSCPKDASWMALSQSLKCTTPSDIYLLLKSSDYISHDLLQAFEYCVDHTGSKPSDGEGEGTKKEQPKRQPLEGAHLVLRKWYSLDLSMEYRCFVRNRQLIAISQRDHVNYYDFLAEQEQETVSLLNDFFNTHIKDQFPDPDYVFDIYINKTNKKVFLIDFNPFSPTTDGLLFDWAELLTLDTLQFRIIKSRGQASQSLQPAHATNRLPKDVIDLSDGTSIAEFAARFKEEVERAA